MTAQELATAYTAMTGRIARADKGIQLDLFREIAEVGPKVVETLVAIENAIPVQKLQELGIRGTFDIARNIALWDKFGVAVDTSAEIFVDLLRVFNTAPQEVIPAMEEVTVPTAYDFNRNDDGRVSAHDPTPRYLQRRRDKDFHEDKRGLVRPERAN